MLCAPYAKCWGGVGYVFPCGVPFSFLSRWRGFLEGFGIVACGAARRMVVYFSVSREHGYFEIVYLFAIAKIPVQLLLQRSRKLP
jgi:hypothetical protein